MVGCMNRINSRYKNCNGHHLSLISECPLAVLMWYHPFFQKMRLPLPVRPTSRKPQDEKLVPLKIMRPLKLRDYVSGKGEKGAQAVCLQEMTIMMACLKTSEFDQVPCSNEIANFQACVTESRKDFLEREEMMKKGVTAGARKLNHIQVNRILQKYPRS